MNKEAISAGAYIAIATQEIAFAPFSQIGAAEAVSGGGGEIDPSMKRKINSYLKAKSEISPVLTNIASGHGCNDGCQCKPNH